MQSVLAFRSRWHEQLRRSATTAAAACIPSRRQFVTGPLLCQHGDGMSSLISLELLHKRKCAPLDTNAAVYAVFSPRTCSLPATGTSARQSTRRSGSPARMRCWTWSTRSTKRPCLRSRPRPRRTCNPTTSLAMRRTRMLKCRQLRGKQPLLLRLVHQQVSGSQGAAYQVANWAWAISRIQCEVCGEPSCASAAY